jgi:hypothetical protein
MVLGTPLIPTERVLGLESAWRIETALAPEGGQALGN